MASTSADPPHAGAGTQTETDLVIAYRHLARVLETVDLERQPALGDAIIEGLSAVETAHRLAPEPDSPASDRTQHRG